MICRENRLDSKLVVACVEQALLWVGIELGTAGPWSVCTVRCPVYPRILGANEQGTRLEVVDTILVLFLLAPGLGSDPQPPP